MSPPPDSEPGREAVLGLHHITAIARDPQSNHDFYAGLLGLRLVKRSVNQDDPTTYHLFYADGAGTPGSDITFFPWRHLPPARPGVGLAREVMLAVPHHSLPRWAERLDRAGVQRGEPRTRFGERLLPLRDPDGLQLALVELPADTDAWPDFQPWRRSPVAVDMQIRGLHGVRLPVRELGPSAAFLQEALGFAPLAEEDNWQRFGLPAPTGDADGASDDAPDGAIGGSGRFVELRAEPDGRRGAWGLGSVHHVAWGVRDDAHQRAVRQRVAEADRRPTEVIDRFWFRSVYFMEPGGVLFELATLGPGFAVDEAPDALGETLILPPWLEAHRPQIEAGLAPLDTRPAPESAPESAAGGTTAEERS